jgi:hypothetical protein
MKQQNVLLVWLPAIFSKTIRFLNVYLNRSQIIHAECWPAQSENFSARATRDER